MKGKAKWCNTQSDSCGDRQTQKVLLLMKKKSYAFEDVKKLRMEKRKQAIER